MTDRSSEPPPRREITFQITVMYKRAKDLISELRLQPHTEGGYFQEIFKSARRAQSAAVSLPNSCRCKMNDSPKRLL